MRQIFRTKIEEHKNNLKMLWATLKSLRTKEKPKYKQSNIGLNINESLSFDKAIADSFNKFFTTIASDLVQKLPVNTGDYGEPQVKKYYDSKGIGEEQFSFTQITTIIKMLRGLDTNKATSLDAIPAKFLRDAAEVIAPYVTHIINL